MTLATIESFLGNVGWILALVQIPITGWFVWTKVLGRHNPAK